MLEFAQQPHESREPAPQAPRGFGSRAGQFVINALDLCPPTADDPGHFKTDDGFVSFNAGVLKDICDPADRFRVLVTFDRRDLPAVTKRRIAAELPNKSDVTGSVSRRALWSKMLQISKEARTERVADIVQELDSLGVDVPAHNIIVHRVSNTFFATLDLELLRQLIALHAEGYSELRRIYVQKITDF